jgi:hypothetical protein
MRKGLDEESRNHIAKLVSNNAQGSAVREAIRLRVRSTNFDYGKNIEFLDWLRRKEYGQSADYLVRLLEGRE